MNKYEIHALLPEVMPDKFCISPFQNTKQSATSHVSTCAYASDGWYLPGLTADQKWDSEQANQRRLESINNVQSAMCERCWVDEAAGKPSLRQRQSEEYFPDDYEQFIRSGKWLTGPRNASFRVSNICNLACRSCFALDSNYYRKEGAHYVTKYNSIDPRSNIYQAKYPATHMDFTEYYDFVSNTSKIDFYGGEPLLNTTHLDLLEHVISSGRSKQVELYYATNCSIPISGRMQRIWEQFKQVGFGISIDGIDTHAEYLRWPCKWNEVETNVKKLISIRDEGIINCYVMGSYTVSGLNVLEVDSMISWYNDMLGKDRYFINMVNFPSHLAIRSMPEYVKQEILNTVQLPEVRQYVTVSDYSPANWKKFIVWNKRMDEYRNQSLASSLPDLYNLIKDDWDSVTDLSEESLNTPMGS
jgi:sulfatase maturation enzyme AslB (radical SAM superfamily)